MSKVDYTVTVTGGDVQEFGIAGGGTNQVVSEADTDAAVQAFASSLSSVSGLVVNYIRKTTTTVSDTTL
jgi:hypothetical protein